MTYQFEITDGTFERKYAFLRFCLYVLVAFNVFLFTTVDDRSVIGGELKFVYEFLTIPFKFCVASLILLTPTAIWAYWKTTRTPKLGLLSFSLEYVEIQNLSLERIYYRDMSELRIERGARHHYNYQGDNLTVNNDNHIVFGQNREQRSVEFLIVSEEQNEDFEQMLKDLRKANVKFRYLSV